MDTPRVTLGYWDIRGLAEPIRALLEYLSIPYDQDKYTSIEQWTEKKTQATYAFPNLPYLVDGEKVITESEAISAYLCLKANKPEMIGKLEDRVEFLQLKGVVGDLLENLGTPCYDCKSLEELKLTIDKYVETSGFHKLSGIDKVLEKRGWLLGYMTYLDFLFAELVERYSTMDKEVGTKVIANYPNLQAYLIRFLELPQMKTYRESGKFKARPYGGFAAFWK